MTLGKIVFLLYYYLVEISPGPICRAGHDTLDWRLS